MAIDKSIDSAQLDADLTSVANAIRTKGGTSAPLAFPADFVSAIEDIETGGGGEQYLTAEYVATSANCPAALLDYPLKPKYQNELILWIMDAGQTGFGGSWSMYMWGMWLVQGALGSSNRGLVIGGNVQTAWSASASIGFGARSNSDFSIDENGYLVRTTGTSDYFLFTAGKRFKLYEFPFNPAEVS